MTARLEAAAELARSEAAEAWVVVLLLDPTSGHFDADEDPNPNGIAEALDRAVVAQVLENLPNTASDEVLWATTRWLSETGFGKYPEFEGALGFGKMAQARTPALRELARETLKRALGVDKGYDMHEWRREIVARQR